MSNRGIEMALRLFSPRGALHEPTTRHHGALGRDEIIGALQVAASGRTHGYHYLIADHLADPGAIDALLDHFSGVLGGAELGATALAVLMRRPLPHQIGALISSHPYYDKERRRAAVVMERAKRSRRHDHADEYRRLLDERNAIMSIARDRCADEIMQTGRCPPCGGTGHRPRKGDQCPQCNGTGLAVPDLTVVARSHGNMIRLAMEQAIDEVLAQASELSRIMLSQIKAMTAEV